MKEEDWVESMARRLKKTARFKSGRLEVRTKFRLAYEQVVRAYASNHATESVTSPFQTDLTVIENAPDGTWLPRVVIEAKVNNVTTHDALTYSAKAAAHRSIHPYLRYGVMLGNRGDRPLPGRLHHHGAQFDFIISFRRYRPDDAEMSRFLMLVRAEVDASRTLEKMLLESRLRTRERFTYLHRKLETK